MEKDRILTENPLHNPLSKHETPCSPIPKDLRRGDKEDFDALVHVEGHRIFNPNLVDFFLGTVGVS